MELDKQYKKVISVLHKDFGWIALNKLPDRYKDLVNDIIQATRQVNKIDFKPPIPKPKIDTDNCAHIFVMKKDIFRCVICNTTIGQWMIKNKDKDETTPCTINLYNKHDS